MTQINPGVSFKGRLPQIVGQAALAASVLAGGASLLNAGGAMAANCLGTNGDKFDLITLTSAPPSLNCSSPVAGNNLLVTIDSDFPSPGELPGPASGKSEFSIESKHGHFLKVLLDSDFDTPPGTVTKTLWADAGFTIPILTDSPLVSTNGSSTGFIGIKGNYNKIYVRDEYVVGSGGQLDNYTNTFETVPGPLPILGAGAAFGFSRKLRSRIKAGRTA
jgi:hypothetical protein